MRFIERIVLDDNISTDKFETTVEAKIKISNGKSQQDTQLY